MGGQQNFPVSACRTTILQAIYRLACKKSVSGQHVPVTECNIRGGAFVASRRRLRPALPLLLNLTRRAGFVASRVPRGRSIAKANFSKRVVVTILQR